MLQFLKCGSGNTNSIVSVWATLEEYSHYVYQSQHQEVLKRRDEWFEQFDGPSHAMLWFQEGRLPTAEEARERLEYLRSHGDTPYAFSLEKTFPAPDEAT